MNNLKFPKALYDDAIVKDGEPLSLHTSMKVGGKADYYIRPRSEEAAVDVVGALGELGVPYFIMGGGTNVIARDGGFRGAVIDIGKGMDAVKIDAARGIVVAGAGAALRTVAKLSAEACLSGLEPISGIPGTVGGALYMNAGSYGGDMSQTVIQARVYDATAGKTKMMSLYEMRLGYRTSVFQTGGPYVILSVTFQMEARDPADIRSDMRKYARRRSAKQPMEVASAGSFFKRPYGGYAGELIERAGMKGERVGGAQVSEKHAGFIVNTGGAMASDVLTLMERVREVVLKDSGVLLEPEPLIIGEDD
ncbi:MAG: UDP-N-acetylmuramate dehydrogenase [Clostridiales Family XIII bacterium]|nr:UDP-N-acetylmuramate dehydrogenase [Clostridiales Family XIII bacterium]